MPKKNRIWGRWVACGPAFIESGQGRLYFVTDSSGEFEGEYVLKELKNPKRIDRFKNELQAIAALEEHPNVVPLIDSGIYRDPEKPSYVMPKAEGTLEDYIKNNPVSIEDRLYLFDQICEGVAYLHRTCIIHRDIKPENILMFSEGATSGVRLDFQIFDVNLPPWLENPASIFLLPCTTLSSAVMQVIRFSFPIRIGIAFTISSNMLLKGLTAEFMLFA